MTHAPGEFWIENRRGANTLGIGESCPRLSWRWEFGRDEPAVLQAKFEDGTLQTVPVRTVAHLFGWPFRPLASRERVRLSVHLADPHNHPARPVAVVEIETGLIEPADWQVGFVTPSPSAPQGELRPAFLLRAEFDLADLGTGIRDVARARVYSTAHGVYELELNGTRVGNDVLAPGWTSYRHRLRYQTYDLTDGLRDRENVIGAWLADGWYRGRIGFDGGLWDYYGSDVSVLVQLEVTTRSGELHRVPLTWTSLPAAIGSAGLYEGETYDARRHPAGWSEPGFDGRDWTATKELPREAFTAVVEAPTAAPVEVVESLSPVSVERMPSGRIRLDFGQNVTGKLRLRVHGEPGHTLRLHHAEVLEDGELGIRPLRSAVSVDEYVCNGRPDVWTPRFTLHGFRYAELENWPGGDPARDVEALVVHTRMTRTGHFTCSDPSLQQLHDNVVWSMRDNFVDLPTDCPQRDERLGWTGDIQVFAPTAVFLYACEGLLAGWLRDVAAEQQVKGHVPVFVPWVDCGFPDVPTAAWGDAAVIVPWVMYQHDADVRVLQDQYDSMCRWVDLVDRLTGRTGLWSKGMQLGDWLDPAAPPHDPGESQTDKRLVATAYHAKSARIVAKTAALLGRASDAARYGFIARRAVKAFQAEFLSSSGRVVNDTPTALSLAIVFDLLDTLEQRDRAGKRLRELVEDHGYHIATGFVGTPIICDALADTGNVDTAYRLLLQQECPSWLYPVAMGATTVWERWDSMLPDGRINPGSMTSFNHYALGAVADFLHRVVAGLDKVGPGYSRLRIAPMPGGGLTSAGARLDTPAGWVSSSWVREADQLTLTVGLPPDVQAEVLVPGSGEWRVVGPGNHSWTTTFREPADDPGASLPLATTAADGVAFRGTADERSN